MTSPSNAVQNAWSRVARDYRRHILPSFLPAARTLCRAVAIGPGDVVLDVACGPGTAAFVAHDLGAARTIGIDFAPGMVRLASQETAGSSRLHFAAGNALALPFAAERFDVVISSFGLVFAPDPVLAAAEAAWVLRSRGRLGLLAWSPDGSVGTYQQILLRHFEPPPGTHDAFQWGAPAQARAWLNRFDQVELLPLEVPLRAESPADAWRILRTAMGRISAGYEALGATARTHLDADMNAFFARFRTADGGICWGREAFVIRGVRQ
jgi:ubiquinone/menaquinone biosynthesis C-methylase UbiE